MAEILLDHFFFQINPKNPEPRPGKRIKNRTVRYGAAAIVRATKQTSASLNLSVSLSGSNKSRDAQSARLRHFKPRVFCTALAAAGTHKSSGTCFRRQPYRITEVAIMPEFPPPALPAHPPGTNCDGRECHRSQRTQRDCSQYFTASSIFRPSERLCAGLGSRRFLVAG